MTSYRSLIIAGNSPMGKKLAKEANDGTLTWKDLNDAKWGLESTSSAAGYMYPSQWLTENFKHSIRDLKIQLLWILMIQQWLNLLQVKLM